MEPFIKHRGVVAVLDRSNVDTDQIIPKQFLKSIRRTGFGEALFFDWRYRKDGTPEPAFALNHPAYAGASILVARNNFGCGSSREHAVWAVMQYGFRVVVAPWKQGEKARIPAFADIFRNNGFGNGLLLIELSEADVDRIARTVEAHKGIEAEVDLAAQKFILQSAPALVFPFDIDAGVKERLIGGLDAIGITLQQADRIAAFEQAHDAQKFW